MEYLYTQLDPLIDDVEMVLAIRANALKLLSQGVVRMEYTAEGTEWKKEFAAPVQAVLAETRAFLKNYDPQKYGYIARSSRQIRM